MNCKDFFYNNQWIKTIFWIIITAIITLGVERSCSRIMPEDPIVVKEVSDTIKFVHSYDFGNINDSLTNGYLRQRLENIELTQKYEEEIIKKGKIIRASNSIMFDVSFPNKKGYILHGAMSYFSFQMSSLSERFIEFEVSFFDNLILSEIYCLILKVYKIENNQRYYFEEQYYNVSNTYNLIRIANYLPRGSFEFSVGFILKKDRMAEYPNVYQTNRIVSKDF